MGRYQFQFSKQAQKDITQLTAKQKTKLRAILTDVLSENPYLGKPLKGNLEGLRSYRLTLKDRILYEIYESENTILIIRAKSHYGE